ncbi:hypothetical protein WA158_006465 [Blastocystis sp. Blastoise]
MSNSVLRPKFGETETNKFLDYFNSQKNSLQARASSRLSISGHKRDASRRNSVPSSIPPLLPHLSIYPTPINTSLPPVPSTSPSSSTSISTTTPVAFSRYHYTMNNKDNNSNSNNNNNNNSLSPSPSPLVPNNNTITPTVTTTTTTTNNNNNKDNNNNNKDNNNNILTATTTASSSIPILPPRSVQSSSSKHLHHIKSASSSSSTTNSNINIDIVHSNSVSSTSPINNTNANKNKIDLSNIPTIKKTNSMTFRNLFNRSTKNQDKKTTILSNTTTSSSSLNGVNNNKDNNKDNNNNIDINTGNDINTTKLTIDAKIISKGDIHYINLCSINGLSMNQKVLTVVENQELIGFIRYIGNIPRHEDIYVGIELITENKLGGYGTIDGFNFFLCPKYKGIFVKLTSVKPANF